MSTIDVYSRRGCHLCELLIDELLELVGTAADINVHDVDSRADWRDRYGLDVPVVEIHGTAVCMHRLDRKAVVDALAADA